MPLPSKGNNKNRCVVENSELPFVERIKKESTGFNKLPKQYVEREKQKEVGYLIALVKKLGRGLSENEYRELGNIL